MIDEPTAIKQCHSLPVSHGMRLMIDEAAIKQCHSLPVGHGLRHDQ